MPIKKRKKGKEEEEEKDRGESRIVNVLDESARFSIQGRVKRGDNSNRRQLSVTL